MLDIHDNLYKYDVGYTNRIKKFLGNVRMMTNLNDNIVALSCIHSNNESTNICEKILIIPSRPKMNNETIQIYLTFKCVQIGSNDDTLYMLSSKSELFKLNFSKHLKKVKTIHLHLPNCTFSFPNEFFDHQNRLLT